VARRHLGRRLQIEVAFGHHPLDNLVQQPGQLGCTLAFVVVASAQGLEHLGGELTAVHQGVQNRLSQRLDRMVSVFPRVTPVGMVRLTTGESRLEQEIRKLVEQGLQVDGIGHLWTELLVGVETHTSPC
jgi:hypothetical protein